MTTFSIRYVIAFLVYDNKVLLLKRHKEPWKNCWNGVGGKIEADETPKQSVVREISEETGIELRENDKLKFTGIVTWEWNDHSQTTIPGMYTFIVHLQSEDGLWEGEKQVQEGTLAWKNLDWVNVKDNPEVAGNLPYFLPKMLQITKRERFHCSFTDGKLAKVTRLPYPRGLYDYRS